ncbi:MAG: lytic murein transglycosylase [Rhodospirillaceae bacterium]|nr:lytic murein transglycosylase [Rhodospirillaceae bacterium]
MVVRQVTIAGAMLAVAACSAPTASGSGSAAAAGTVAGPAPAATYTPARPATFPEWLADFRVEALAYGISPATFDAAFANVTPDPQVIEYDNYQPEFTRPIWEYLDNAISASRVSGGQQRMQQNAALLSDVERRYGVDRRFIVAIWGLESGYGGNVGSFDVIRSLATLAYEGNRTERFREFLLQALEILDRGDISRQRMVGSWAGAMGQTQFMPGSYLAYAVDGDGDGHRDLWDSLPDVFASTGNYLADAGWKSGETWGAEVVLPAGFDYRLTGDDTRRSVADWQAMGVRAAGGGALPPTSGQASVIVPAGHRGPAFLVYDNFRSILRYNNATSYALAVSLLADQLEGRGQLVAAWPRDQQQLSREDRVDLQTLLTARGYDTRGVDGIIGPNSREAVRAFQAEIGLPQDGYPTMDLLTRLRQLQTG